MTNARPNFPKLSSSGGLLVGTIMHLCGSKYCKGPAVPRVPWKELFFPSPTAISGEFRCRVELCIYEHMKPMWEKKISLMEFYSPRINTLPYALLLELDFRNKY